MLRSDLRSVVLPMRVSCRPRGMVQAGVRRPLSLLYDIRHKVSALLDASFS